MKIKGSKKTKSPERAVTVSVTELPDGGEFVATVVAADGTTTTLATGTEAEVEQAARAFACNDERFEEAWRQRDRRLNRERIRHAVAAA